MDEETGECWLQNTCFYETRVWNQPKKNRYEEEAELEQNMGIAYQHKQDMASPCKHQG